MEKYTREQLEGLSEDQYIEIILRQQEIIEQQQKQIRKLQKRVAELERQLAELKKPNKDSSNSSTPPSQDHKENKGSNADQEEDQQEDEVDMGPPEGHEGTSRENQDPDLSIDQKPDECSCCGRELGRVDGVLTGSSQMTVLPPLSALVVQMNRYRKSCPDCGTDNKAGYPEGWNPKGMFGPRIHRLTAYLKHEQHFSYDRLENFYSDWFGLQVSEGGIDNILNRAGDEMQQEAEKIRDQLQLAEVIGSDETGVRVNGENWWEWVFQTDEVSYHTIVNSRSGSVIEQALPRGSPTVWESDLYSSQMSAPAEKYQICLSHQQRELQYAIDCGEDVFAPRMKDVFFEAMRLNEEIDWQEGYTYTQKREKRRIKQDFWGLLMIETETEEAGDLKERFRRHHDKLFTFLDYEEVSPTNNASERDLRGSVIHRKVTNCFRSEWGAQAYAAFKSIRDTARRTEESIVEKLQEVMDYSIPQLEQKLQASTL